jgi:UDP-N-acetylglucosamine/UDP-N-acetylgalactosamine diphosphorylase
MTTKTEFLEFLQPHHQEHLIAFWDKLTPEGKAALATEIRGIDYPLIARLHRQAPAEEKIRELAARAGTPPSYRLGDAAGQITPDAACRRGIEALRAGQVGVILVAGGQGTRLGFDHPKGMFPIGPVSGNSLFQIHVEKIVASARRYGVKVPLYLMTSPATHDATVAYFADHGRFGLGADELRIFCQGTMPAVDAATGQVLLAEPGHVALSPDGHGGMLAALAASGGLTDAESRGLRSLFYLQVDNPLVEICGPEFLGYHLLAGSELTTQVIRKRSPLEKVGNVVEVDGRLRVIEYSDLPDEVAERLTPDGSLAIWAGSIGVHVMDVAFLARTASQAEGLPFHLARKKVAHVDAAGHSIKPGEPNAIKFERFIFDLMPSAEHSIVVEVDPARHFAPLKNASGESHSTPESVRAQLVALHGEWLRKAGATVAGGTAVEISPLFALDAEEAAGKVRPGTEIGRPTYFR